MATSELILRSLRGGLNEADSPFIIGEDQCVEVKNIDFDRGPLGGRRRGTTPLTALTGNTLSAECFFLFRHLPSDDQTASELWAASHSGGSFVINRKTTAWSAISPAVAWTSGARYRVEGISLHGKLFLTGPLTGGIDRMLVWDGTTLRLAGFLTNHAAGTVANTGAGAYAATPRYYRIRWTQQTGGVTVRRSEAVVLSTSMPFTPSGTGTAARVTRGTAPSESETHWELEASTDGVTYYRIATTAVATTTYDDSATPSTYSTTGVLSEDTGDYIPLPAGKFLAADEDRLLIGGSWVTAAYRSRIWWTPVFGATGVGNDERVPTDTNNYLDLDNFEGGELTDLAGPLQGYIYAFKLGHIYKLIRRGTVNQAYEAVLLTNRVGALPRSVIEGFDEVGLPCLYFLDRHLGPMMIGRNGIERCGMDIAGTRASSTWSTVNFNASLICHGLFYPDVHQAMWWLSTSAATLPNLVAKVWTKGFQRTEQGVRGGWGHDTGGRAAALCAVMYADNIDDNAARSLKLKPLIGIASGTASKLIQKCDTGNQDDGVSYRAYLRTRPFVVGSILRKVGVMTGQLVAKAGTGVQVMVKAIRDFGKETTDPVQVSLTPSIAGEDPVIKHVDLRLSDAYALQVELGDEVAQNADWVFEQVGFKLRTEEGK